MALSNWDTLAVDLKGKSIPGSFTSPLGVTGEIYKNWIYIRDQKAWRKGGGFENPTVIEMHQGIIQYQDVHIEAIRGPQNGIYLVCYHVEYTKDREAVYTGMIGCGVYGYKRGKWVGVEEKSSAFLQRFASRTESDYTLSDAKRVVRKYLPEPEGKEFDAAVADYIKPHSYFAKEIASVAINSKAVRYNQGDAFFSQQANAPLQATPVGKAKQPHLVTIIKSTETKIANTKGLGKA